MLSLFDIFYNSWLWKKIQNGRNSDCTQSIHRSFVFVIKLSIEWLPFVMKEIWISLVGCAGAQPYNIVPRLPHVIKCLYFIKDNHHPICIPDWTYWVTANILLFEINILRYIFIRNISYPCNSFHSILVVFSSWQSSGLPVSFGHLFQSSLCLFRMVVYFGCLPSGQILWPRLLFVSSSQPSLPV